MSTSTTGVQQLELSVEKEVVAALGVATVMLTFGFESLVILDPA
jgi:hypothetical protein